MSIMWPDALAQPMQARPLKIGRMRTTSCRWRPPPSCGSLARKTSPGAMRSNRVRTTPMASAETPKWNGTVDAVATIRPAGSYSTQEKSRASLITGETAVLTTATDISRVMCWRRLRITSSVIGSARSATLHLDPQVPEGLDAGPRSRREEDRRVAPLDQRRAGERHAGSEALAVVDRHAPRAVIVAEPYDARAPARGLRVGRTEGW